GGELLHGLSVPHPHQPRRTAGCDPLAVTTERDARPLHNLLILSLEASDGLQTGHVPGHDVRAGERIVPRGYQTAAIGAEGHGSKRGVPSLSSEGRSVACVPELQLAERRVTLARGC